MATVTEFNTPSIIITVILVVIIIIAILLSLYQKKKGRSCCGNCTGCNLCNKESTLDIDNLTVKPLSRSSYKSAIQLLEIQKTALSQYKHGQKYIFYKALSNATDTKGLYFNETLEGFAIFNKHNEAAIANPFIKLYVKIKEISKPYREYALSLNEKENPENGILLIAVNPLENSNKLIELLLN